MKKTIKKSAKPKSSGVSKEREYLNSLDLMELWYEFFNSFEKNGTQKYPTVWSFIKRKAKHRWQRDFLYWLLGPTADTKGESRYPGFPQHDWEAKRERGFWYSNSNIEKLQKEIRNKGTSFDKLQTAGESLIEDIAQITELQRQLRKEFGGQLYLQGMDAGENSARVREFINLNQQLQQQKADLIHLYAKTVGMDMNQLADFLQLFTSGIGKAAAASAQLGYGGGKTIEGELEDGRGGGINAVLRQLNEVTLRKAADLELPLPDEMKEVVQGAATEKRKSTKPN